jgi:hypothetical protein
VSQQPHQRTVLPALLTAIALVAALIGLTLLVKADRSRQTAASLQDVARRTALPAGSTPYSGVQAGCPAAQYVHCVRTAEDVDSAAREMRAALGVAAEEEPTSRCRTLHNPRSGANWRSCMVQIQRGSHAVTIWIDPWTDRSSNHTSDGAQITIEAG